MKSYTDIEQSKTLAKILPIESADMCYCMVSQSLTDKFQPKLIAVPPKYSEDIPAWSLAALLTVYPMVVGRDMDMYCCWQNSKNLHSRHYDNPIDACIEMIIKLKEKGLI